MWEGRSATLLRVHMLVCSEAGHAARRRRNGRRRGIVEVVSVACVLDVAEVDALTASSHGGDVTTSHATVAAATGWSESAVKRARSVLVRLELVRVLEEGRYLTKAERAAATAAHGGRQLRMASRRAFTTSSTAGPLPRSGYPARSTSPSRGGSKRASGAAGRKIHPRRSAEAVPLSIKRLAACLVDREAAAVDGRGASLALTALDPRWRSGHAVARYRVDGVWRSTAALDGHLGQVWRVLVRLAPLMRRAGITIEGDFAASQRAAATLIRLRDTWGATEAGYAHPAEATNPLGAFYDACRRALEQTIVDATVPTAQEAAEHDAAARARADEERRAHRARVEHDAAMNRARLAAERAEEDARRERLAHDAEAQSAAAAFFAEALGDPARRVRSRRPWRLRR